jgi:hypothetical protein
MHELCGWRSEMRLNVAVIRRSPTLTVQPADIAQFLIFHPLLRSK